MLCAKDMLDIQSIIFNNKDLSKIFLTGVFFYLIGTNQMNIFFSSSCPKISASNLCKRHINKMYQESIQMLSTVLQQTGVVDNDLCKPVHESHPCTKWVKESIHHYQWLLEHALALRELYWKPVHGYDKYLEAILRHHPDLSSKPFSEPPKVINTEEWPDLRMSVIFDSVEECYKKYLRAKYINWTVREDKRKLKVEFVGSTPEYMEGVL